MSKTSISVNVKTGSVHVNYIWIENKDRALCLVQMDCKQKYPQCGSISDEQVSIYPTDNERAADYEKEPTIVEFPALPKGWGVIHAWGGRYTFSVLLGHKRSDTRRTQIWADDFIPDGEMAALPANRS